MLCLSRAPEPLLPRSSRTASLGHARELTRHRHAGYSYSGQAAAYAYKSLDLTGIKRVFILGPSHHFYLTNCALSTCRAYSTPIGELALDRATIDALNTTGKFSNMSLGTDEDEHSIEMHLPYLRHLMNRSGVNLPIVPILVGNTTAASERAYGRLLAPHLSNKENAFVVSSDFAHWGARFRYTYYQPHPGPEGRSSGRNLGKDDRLGSESLPICDSIGQVDLECMEVCETGNHDKWLEVLKDTGNTVCGRHPIGVFLAAAEELGRGDKTKAANDGTFRFVRYERSSEVVSFKDSSVSYGSAFARP